MSWILVLTDFSQKSKNAADYAWKLAETAKCGLVFATITEVPDSQAAVAYSGGVYYDNYSQYDQLGKIQLEMFANEIVERNAVADREQPPIMCINEIGSFKKQFLPLEERQNIWLTVMGGKSDEAGFSRFLKQSETNVAIENGRFPTLFIPEEVRFMPLCNLQFAAHRLDANELKALGFVVELAKVFDATVTVTHVNLVEGDEESFARKFEELKEQLNYEHLDCRQIDLPETSAALIQSAFNLDCAVISIVHRRYSFPENLFHVSTTKKLMEYRLLPILVFPPGF